MNNNHNWINSVLLALVLGLLAWSIFKKDNNLKQAVSDLKAAKTEIENAKKNLDNALKINQEIIEGNHGFQKYISSVDSITRKRDIEAQRREQQFMNTLTSVNNSIEKLKADLAKSNARLMQIPVGNLTEEK